MTSHQSEASLGELFGQLGSDMSLLLRKEVELARVEARDEIRRTTRALTLGVVAALAALLALILLSIALAWWLDEVVDNAVAFAIVGAAWTLIAVIAATSARTAFRRIQPLPETASAIKGAVTGERAQPEPAGTSIDTRTLSPTHQISDTRPHESEHTS
jgi:uncharacterized membrane protein YqjE